MSKLFEATEINGMKLANRFVRSATFEGMAATDGAVTPRLINTMTALAKGGVGLIITSHAYVQREGQAAPLQIGVYKDELLAGLKEMTEAVHASGGKIIMQLSHAGRAAFGQPPLLVSKLAGDDPLAKEIGLDDINQLVAAYAAAAARAKAAGFDGVEIHCAHGYLLSQFLTPALNCRQDQYGGSIENRTRIHVEIIKAVRKVVGEQYPVIVKLNSRDFIEDGLQFLDALQAGKILAAAGIDAIELSGGVITSKLGPSRINIKTENDEAYFREEAKELKKLVDIPLILVGGIRSFQVAESLVDSGTADYLSMSRPFIREPELINRWQSGDLNKALCVSDNACFKTAVAGNGVYCAVAAKESKS